MSLPHDLVSAMLRRLDPEDAHTIALKALKAGLGPRDLAPADPILATEVAGLKLPNCVGLAAGFDKNAEVPRAMLRAGFGFVECGGVTPRPQAGNPRPRLFRLSEDRAVINRLGFNNAGLDAFAANLERARGAGVIGANLGANKDSEDRINDYIVLLRRLWGQADFFTVNISSPNTPGLRTLQSGDALDEVLGRVAEARAELRKTREASLWLKVAPDLADADIEALAEAAGRYGFDAMIVTNTTLSRPDSLKSPQKGESGGLSGAPLFPLATRVLAAFHAAAPGLPLIGVGGIGSGADAYAKIRAGASALQFYSAMVYEGPGLITRIKRDLAARLRADGFSSVAEAVGQG
jgi:dihydroorotate dehydrogenase